MELYLNNIGIISDSTIKLNGLTVITGENGHAKTTIGKVLYSIISATENLTENFLIDQIEHILGRVHHAVARFYEFELFNDDFDKVVKELNDFLNASQKESLSNKALSKLKSLIERLKEQYKSLKYTERKTDKYKTRFYTSESLFMDGKLRLLKTLDDLLKELNSDQSIKQMRYANGRITCALREEFHGQIQPINNAKPPSSILLKNADTYFNIPILNDNISTDDQTYYHCPFNGCIFIESARLIDQINSSEFNTYRRRLRGNSPDLDCGASWLDHNQALISKLHQKMTRNSYTANASDSSQEIKGIFQKINEALSEDIFWNSKDKSEGKLFIKQGGQALDIRNLATGAKMFAIIIMLLQRGHFNKETLLVLDEPENHLHPKWQKNFAEIVVLLVKHLGCKIVLTTHSPNFLLGLQVYSMKHEIATDFYQSELQKDVYMTKINNITEEVYKAYASMTEPYEELDEIFRDLYLEKEKKGKKDSQ